MLSARDGATVNPGVTTGSSLIKIGELAIATGCAIETIRWYERIGLLPKPKRGGSNYRRYSPEDTARVRFVAKGRHLGFSLDEIRSLMRLAEHPELTRDEIDELARRHLDDVRARLRALRRLERQLKSALEHCAGGSRADCALLGALGG